MTTSDPRASRRMLQLTVVLAAFACGGKERASYDSVRDDVAMAAIASTWSGDGLALALCEDAARSVEWTGPDGCGVDHVVRGGGLGLAHTGERERGCGGCSYRVIAYVRGTASAAALGDVAVSGEVRLQTSDAPDPYGYPFTLDLVCEAPADCAVTGTLREDGTVAAVLVVGPRGPGQDERRIALARSGAAACP